MSDSSVIEAIKKVIDDKCISKEEFESLRRKVENIEILLAVTKDTTVQVAVPVRKPKVVEAPQAPVPSTAPAESATKSALAVIGTRDKLLKYILRNNLMEYYSATGVNAPFRTRVPNEIIAEVKPDTSNETALATFTAEQWDAVAAKLWQKLRDAKSNGGPDNIYVKLNKEVTTIFENKNVLAVITAPQ
jgi:hypothetical protein